MQSHLRHRTAIDWSRVPGYISYLNFLYRVTEIFEFAARMCRKGVYEGAIQLTVHLRGIRGYLIAMDCNRSWRRYCPAGADPLGKTWTLTCADLVSANAEQAFEAASWFMERFGWLPPNIDALRKDQQEFLAGLV